MRCLQLPTPKLATPIIDQEGGALTFGRHAIILTRDKPHTYQTNSQGIQVHQYFTALKTHNQLMTVKSYTYIPAKTQLYL